MLWERLDPDVRVDDFYQTGPSLGNQYDADDLLRSYLRWRLPAAMLAGIEPDLHRFGERVVTDVLAMSDAAEAQPPRHVPYDPWGRRIDDVIVSDGWRALERVSAEEGLVAIGYERAYGDLSRVYQMAKLYLFHPSSATYSCPLAMGDGAARYLEVYGDERTRAAYRRLTTRDPARFWTSGQWMTERTGGSDVAQTTTVARRAEHGTFRLYGTKWFTSATTSPMAMTLARIEGAPPGGRGLSVFYVELRDEAGALRDVRVNRLKDKLGTRALPTAELTLDGTPAQLVGGEGDGVRKISTLFNITRIYNTVAAIGGMRRAVALARDYADRRTAFGRLLRDQPLHAAMLRDLEARLRTSFLLAFRVVELLGKEECRTATDGELAMLRLLTPVAKLFTGKEAVAVASEALESFGGAGYIEDTGLPRLLRDAQVLPIWEGTTNVLSLDMLRAIRKTPGLSCWKADLATTLAGLEAGPLGARVAHVRGAGQEVEALAREVVKEGREEKARQLAFALARTTAAARELELLSRTAA